MAKTVVEELVFEYWDCDKCGQKAIRGDIRTCPSCGNARTVYLVEQPKSLARRIILKFRRKKS